MKAICFNPACSKKSAQSRRRSVGKSGSPIDELISDDGTLRVIKGKVATNGVPEKFLRLQVTGQ